MFQSITLFGTTIDLYEPINTLGNLCALIWILFHLKEYRSFSTLSRIPEARLGDKKGNFFTRWFLTIIEAIFIFTLVLTISGPITHEISYIFLGERCDNYFWNIFCVPVLLLLVGLILRISPFKLWDFAVLPINICLIFYKLACFCCGCCYGVESESFGMFNHLNDAKEFPVQLVEEACAIIMFIILLTLSRKKERKVGILYPLYMLMYCGSRFISEFWRGDFPAVWGALKGYHIQCIVGFIEGLIFLFVVLKWGGKLTESFDAKNQKLLERFTKEEKKVQENEQ